ncbi:MAG: LUD domain-containing protein [Chloroflexi bacterium]|nr:LUD domain-containing protein [Chloroflexota bacterium]
MATPVETALVPNLAYAQLASDAQIERTVKALEANGINAEVVENGAKAREKVAELLPAGAEAFISSSTTLNVLGITDDVDKSGRYDSLRVKLSKLDYQTQGREMNKLGAVPEYVLGSVHALTETGVAIIASATGSQLASYASGAAKVIWVVGSQKIVPTVEEGMKRIEEYTYALEDARALKAYGMHSTIAKLLIVNREVAPGRITIVIVKENVGF